MSHKTGIEDHYILKSGKRLQFGYTTGSCAAAAAKAAAAMLLSGRESATVALMTPKGILLELEVLETRRTPERVSCAVRKYSGDDPDVTNGVLVYAQASFRTDRRIVVEGGTGVGRVTKPGLQQGVGEAAINRVPKQMILREVGELLEEYESRRGMDVLISIPAGVELAKKTFNPRLGIEGGISVLGTSGIVEPMSETALLESIRLELRQKRALGCQRLVMCPGNYGVDFIRGLASIEDRELVKCGNYLGLTVDMAVEEGFREILLIAHIGKLIKVAGGIMDTHSRAADARGELMAACALRAGCDGDTARRILECVTTEEMLRILEQTGLMPRAMEAAGGQIQAHLSRRAGEQTSVGTVMFSNERGLLQTTGPAAQWLRELKEREEHEP